MKYAILGDIHSNLEALTQILKDAENQGVTHYACTGDVVGYNADPKECLQKVRSLNCALVQGNHDYYTASNESMELFDPHGTKKYLLDPKATIHFRAKISKKTAFNPRY